MSESNALLASRIRAHDEGACAQLLGRYEPLVFRICMKMLGHRQDAEDATQETFARALRYMHRWDSRRPLEPWLAAIAGNRCRSLLARRNLFRAATITIEPPTRADEGNTAADVLREEVELALRLLPESHRRAFELFHTYSMSYPEIAGELDRPVGTVKTWIHRARRKLIGQLRDREVIAGCPDDPPQEGSHRAASEAATK